MRLNRPSVFWKLDLGFCTLAGPASRPWRQNRQRVQGWQALCRRFSPAIGFCAAGFAVDDGSGRHSGSGVYRWQAGVTAGCDGGQPSVRKSASSLLGLSQYERRKHQPAAAPSAEKAPQNDGRAGPLYRVPQQSHHHLLSRQYFLKPMNNTEASRGSMQPSSGPGPVAWLEFGLEQAWWGFATNYSMKGK